jgi:hypothetical protein
MLTEINPPSITHKVSPVSWQPPPTSKYKVNWDMAVDKNHGHIGIGIVVKDYEGIVLATRSTTKSGAVFCKC